ncbi:Calcium/calmodulin-dependent protein kinase I [Intoshia linei]|uniref:non-specific serine/threonine protein kinase n=1 Tax=Intoshia linei TaxID=1819745 RepID=A0A177BA33_9BILA|nr:Calcium/calmodulin-dependent protein kinase I [Intoshia linei]
MEIVKNRLNLAVNNLEKDFIITKKFAHDKSRFKNKVGKRLKLYANGNKYFNGNLFILHASKFLNLHDLMYEINETFKERMNLPFGIRRIYTAQDGSPILNLKQFEDGGQYVCAGYEGFHKMDYIKTYNKPKWGIFRIAVRHSVGDCKVSKFRQNLDTFRGHSLFSVSLKVTLGMANNWKHTVNNKIDKRENNNCDTSQISKPKNKKKSNGLKEYKTKQVKLLNINRKKIIKHGSLWYSGKIDMYKNSAKENIKTEIDTDIINLSTKKIKPKIINVILANQSPNNLNIKKSKNKKIKYLLYRINDANALDKVIRDLNVAFDEIVIKHVKNKIKINLLNQNVDKNQFNKLDTLSKNSKINKTQIINIFSINAQKIKSVWDFFRNENYYIASRYFTVSCLEVKKIIEDIYGVNQYSNGLIQRWKKSEETLTRQPQMEGFQCKPNLQDLNLQKNETKKNDPHDKHEKLTILQKQILDGNKRRLKNRQKLYNEYKKIMNTDKKSLQNEEFGLVEEKGKRIKQLKPIYEKINKKNPEISKFADSWVPPSKKIKANSIDIFDGIKKNVPSNSSVKSKYSNGTSSKNGKSRRSKKSSISPGGNAFTMDEKSNIAEISVSTQEKPIVPSISNSIQQNNVEDDYNVGASLGDGNFAVVKKAKNKLTNEEFALKIIDKMKMKKKKNMIESEIYIMKQCKHDNIVRFYESYHTENYTYLVLELVKGGDLFDYISKNVKFNERESSIMIESVANALFYLHSQNICHRDVKPENLLVYHQNDNKISLKLTDFGLAVYVNKPLHLVCGTPTYVAPEILNETGYGLEVDIWALGVITYILLCGFPPFRSVDRKQSELFDLIRKGHFIFLEPYWNGISKAAKMFISRMIVVSTNIRHNVLQILSNSWIVSNGLQNTANLKIRQSVRRKQLQQEAKYIQQGTVMPNLNNKIPNSRKSEKGIRAAISIK